MNPRRAILSASLSLVVLSAFAFSLLGLSKVPTTTAQSLSSQASLDASVRAFTGSATISETVVFTPTASLQKARFNHTATLLPNGKVLIVGGSSDKRAELYDPLTETFTTTNVLSISRFGHTATLLETGEVLIAGGVSYGSPVNAELYNSTTNSFTPVSNPSILRVGHAAILLPNGKVLLVGGVDYTSQPIATAELYDPNANTFTPSGRVLYPDSSNTATLLPNGLVLIFGSSSYLNTPGNIPPSELYNPGTGVFSATGRPAHLRYDHTATLLSNGKVIVVGGYNGNIYLPLTELYEVATGTFANTAQLREGRAHHTASLLANGRVLVAGGEHREYLDSAELYDWVSGTFVPVHNMTHPRAQHTATVLEDGRVLIAGGHDGSDSLSSAELATFVPSNTITGTLFLPSNWLTTKTVEVSFLIETLGEPVNAVALSRNGTSWTEWMTAMNGITQSTTWNFEADGPNQPLYLRARDINGQVATVVSGTVNIDTMPPSSSMAALPPVSPMVIPLTWFGFDYASGIAGYDLQVKMGATGEWTTVLSNTTQTSLTYQASTSGMYYFRVQAIDVAGHVEAWPETYDASTRVQQPTSTPTPSASTTPTNSPTLTGTATPPPTSTLTSPPSVQPTNTLTPVPTNTRSPMPPTGMPTASNTPEATSTMTPTSVPTNTPTSTPTATVTSTPTRLPGRVLYLPLVMKRGMNE